MTSPRISVAARGACEAKKWLSLLRGVPGFATEAALFTGPSAFEEAAKSADGEVCVVVADSALLRDAGPEQAGCLWAAKPGAGLVVLCDAGDAALGEELLGRGPADYRMKDALDADMFKRAVLYAADRARAAVKGHCSDERSRELFESNPLPMLIYDLESMRILRVNASAAEHFGYSTAEMLELTLEDLHSAEEWERLRENVNGVTEGRDDAGVWQHLRKGGSVRFAQITSHTTRFEGRRAEIVLIHDVTEERDARNELMRSTVLLRIAGDMAKLGGWHVDLREGRVLWSDETAAVHGKPPGFSPTVEEGMRYYAPEFRGPIQAAFEACVQHGKPYDLELQIINAEGERVWVRSIGEAVRDESGRITGVHGAFQDISTQKAGEAEVRKLASRLYNTLESITDAFFTLDLQWCFKYVNAEAERLLRRARTSLLERNVWTEFPEAVGSTFEREYRRAVESNVTVGFEDYYPPLETWFEVKAYPSNEGLAVYFRDVTLRKFQERLRRGETEILEMIVGESPLGGILEAIAKLADELGKGTLTSILLVEDSEGVKRCLRTGAAPSLPAAFSRSVDGVDIGPGVGSCGTAAFTREEVVTEDIAADPWWAGYREAASVHGLRACWSWPVLDASGRAVATVAMYRREPGRPDDWARELAGRIVHLVSVAVDSRRRAKALRESEARLAEQAALLDKANDAILTRDLDHTILFWNDGAERLYGWTAAEAVGRSIMELLYQEPSDFLAATKSVLETGEWRGEIRQYTKAGTRVVVAGRWTLVRDSFGRPKSILAINSDVTDRKKLEQQFLRAQRMESIGTLAGGIAHDLNNVLSPIMMAMDLLKLRIDDPGALDLLENIRKSARRGADMVSQVLSFARGMEGRRIEVQVRHIVSDIENILGETFPKNITVRTRYPKDLWTVDGDPTQIHQVLLNLCVNARDAMPEGGDLRIAAGNIVVDEQYASMNFEASEGPHVRIEVEDTGTGIPPEVIEKIFDPFFTTKEIGKGTGLGLSTALTIVKSHGGFMRVYSDPGVGTRFRFYLPASAESTNGDEHEEEEELPRGNGETVLVVDDEASVRQITRQTLVAFGYKVLLAADGAEGVAVYAPRREEIDVVLTDIMMPVMDGPSMIRVLRRLNPDVRVIAASGMAANGRMARAADAGVEHFLPKPYSADILLRSIRDVLQAGSA
ncbi:MAG: PAS domain S-box protein [Opitutales bacterium]|nr:PAS domain S-box protein [Opitutales bacterium]